MQPPATRQFDHHQGHEHPGVNMEQLMVLTRGVFGLKRTLMGKRATRAQKEKKTSEAYRPTQAPSGLSYRLHSVRCQALGRRKATKGPRSNQGKLPQEHRRARAEAFAATGVPGRQKIGKAEQALDQSIFAEIEFDAPGVDEPSESEELDSHEPSTLRIERPISPTFRNRELDGSEQVDTTVVAIPADEALVSQALLDMASQKEPGSGLLDLGRPVNEGWSPLPPSSPPLSPPPASPKTPSEALEHSRRSWVSPGEWDDPGSPLPSRVYNRMQWPELFQRLWNR
ncbi:hypothetical protein C8J57DRAFT_1226332 [Mycena rebaudengoi]|nr:hypothetical protein C8J57DRAFT_1226332 [Mycena rebaudengoi]